MSRPVFAIALFATAALCVQAQTATMSANIPFEFRVGKSLMPAGEYTVNQTASVLKLTGPKAVIVLTATGQRRSTDKPSTLVFNRYGNDYFLAKVWAPFASTGSVLRPTRVEQEMVARAGAVQTASIPAYRK